MKGILICAHGSKDYDCNDLLKSHCEKVSGITGMEVRFGLNGVRDPSIKDALRTAFERGLPKIVAVPMFAAPGNHSVKEIPEQLGLTAGRRKIYTVLDRPVQLTYAEEIGTDPLIADILADRAING